MGVDLIRGEGRRREGNGIEEWNKKKEMNRREEEEDEQRGARALGQKPQSLLILNFHPSCKRQLR